MHTLQFLAIEATSKKEAFKLIENELGNKNITHWSDGWEVGGGRWSKYKDKYENVLSYVKDKKLFLGAIDSSKDSRKTDLNALLSGIFNTPGGEAMFIIDALDYLKKGDIKHYGPNAMLHYSFYTIAEMMMGNWCSKSYYYDFVENSSNYSYLQERIIVEPEDQYLVPVDFHF